MSLDIFREIYKNLQFPVIVCEKNDEMTILFANISAVILLAPSLSTSHSVSAMQGLPLGQLFKFHSEDERQTMLRALFSAGRLQWYPTTVMLEGGAISQFFVSANVVAHDGRDYCLLYILREKSGYGEAGSINDVIFSILDASYHSSDVDASIESILSIIGNYIGVSRAYVFEDSQNRNTYEWCAPGIAPTREDLKNLRMAHCKHSAAYSESGAYISDDIRNLPDADRLILSSDDIKALAILPLYHANVPFGYIGFDDCAVCRAWGFQDFQIMRSIASVISSLIDRRNAEKEAKRSLEILQTITDNTDSIIYVSDLATYELKFINRTLAKAFHLDPSDIIGKKCWQVLQKDMQGPCHFCPVPYLLNENSAGNDYEWEFQNTVTGRWFWSKDAIIDWIDGTRMHMETSVDITYRKDYEEQLRQFATIDSLTGIHNREYGYAALQDAHSSVCFSGKTYSLCFIDLDGLKAVNDRYGHQMGDDMIKRAVTAIRAFIRPSDMLCRWGGDEFLVLFDCDAGAAESVMLDIIKDLDATNQTGGLAYTLSLSFGIAGLSADTTVDAVVTAADGVMYENKMSKR